MIDVKNKGIASIVLGIICFIVAFFANSGANSAKGTNVTSYIGGQISSSGTLGSNAKNIEFYSAMCMAFLVSGVILVLLGIILLIASAGTSARATEYKNYDNIIVDKGFIICPKCGEKNGKENNYCYVCQCSLKSVKNHINRSQEAEDDEWKCPDCGKINKNYVGTCGCGRRKP